MAKRYSGDLQISLIYNDRNFYRASVSRNGRVLWKGNVRPAPAGFGPGIAYDSPRAFDAIASSALAFAEDEVGGIGDHADYAENLTGYLVHRTPPAKKTSHATRKPPARARKDKRQGLAVAKRGVRGIYEVLWYRNGAGEVRSLVNRAVVAEYTPGLGWEDHGRLPDDVREYAQQIASAGASSGTLHHETSGRPGPQPKKSHAQIKREVDEILAGSHDGTSSDTARPRYQIPGIAVWNRSAGGTAAAPDKHGYSLRLPEGEYHVSPVSSPHGRHRGYSLMFAARQQPRGSHGGLWHDLGMHRSPAKAAVAARKHYAESY